MNCESDEDNTPEAIRDVQDDAIVIMGELKKSKERIDYELSNIYRKSLKTNSYNEHVEYNKQNSLFEQLCKLFDLSEDEIKETNASLEEEFDLSHHETPTPSDNVQRIIALFRTRLEIFGVLEESQETESLARNLLITAYQNPNDLSIDILTDTLKKIANEIMNEKNGGITSNNLSINHLLAFEAENFHGDPIRYGVEIISNCYRRFALLHRIDGFLKFIGKMEGLGQEFMHEVAENEVLADGVMTKENTEGSPRLNEFLDKINDSLNYYIKERARGKMEGIPNTLPDLCVVVRVIENKFGNRCNDELLREINTSIQHLLN